MEFSDGTQWRINACAKLKNLGVVCLNPYEDFFAAGKISEDGLHSAIQSLRKQEDYDQLEYLAKNVRNYDLAAVAKSDFIIAYINTDVFCFGTIEEIVRANILNKPIYVICEQGRQKAPFWLLSLVPANCIFDNFDEIYDKLQLIHININAADLDKWSFLNKSLR